MGAPRVENEADARYLERVVDDVSDLLGHPLEAHADLRARLVEDRISLGLRALLAST